MGNDARRAPVASLFLTKSRAHQGGAGSMVRRALKGVFSRKKRAPKDHEVSRACTASVGLLSRTQRRAHQGGAVREELRAQKGFFTQKRKDHLGNVDKEASRDRVG